MGDIVEHLRNRLPLQIALDIEIYLVYNTDN